MQDAIAALAWNRTAEEQVAARQAILDDLEFDVAQLILPKQGKAIWRNAALVLAELGPVRIGDELPNVLVWLQDTNWPGASIILHFMAGLPGEILMPALEIAVQRAKTDNDEEWLVALGLLAETRSRDLGLHPGNPI